MNNRQNVLLVILTNNRPNKVYSLVEKYNNEFKILISDSGESIDHKKLPLQVSVSRNNAKNGLENLVAIAKEISQPALFLHDDDELLNYKDFLKTITDEDKVVCSPKYRIKKRVRTFKELCELYFTDPSGNCSLISGVYFANPSRVDFNVNYQRAGKYGDFILIAEWMKSEGYRLVTEPYVDYCEHAGNDNKIRNAKDREGLAKYVEENDETGNRLFSNLVIGLKGYTIQKFIDDFFRKPSNLKYVVPLAQKAIGKLNEKF